MSILFPNIDRKSWPAMAWVALSGMLIGGIYGIFHDLVTFQLSPDYFILYKFPQFWYLDFGGPAIVWAASIGFVAVGGVGLIVGWFFARLLIPYRPLNHCFKLLLICFSIVLLVSFAFALICYLSMFVYELDQPFTSNLRLQKFEINLLRVSYLHFASYGGGLAGFFIAVYHLCRVRHHVDRASAGPALSKNSPK